MVFADSKNVIAVPKTHKVVLYYTTVNFATFKQLLVISF